ncbi:YncE family protein [Flavisolibacter ginsenosidimutans]|uniref:YncE family protein n=1 Tax=Flavisolibacter ginsenosidimutans TaxID=661481 RepID=A0A5B8UKT5_9BACT|nr:YncE family protein [Flavisolibacter ginsenosidimutans]QEC57168.1 YncE family protein [Flavisolibacter ginsenosidimutans]
MKKIILFFGTAICLQANAQTGYKVVKTFHIQSPGGWDYISVNNGKVYASHGTQVNILDEATGDSAGFVPNTAGVHGIAFDNELNRGYTSNGRSNNVTVFDLKTLQLVTQIATGEGPDAIMFEPHTQTVITCNGRAKNLSVIDPKTNAVVATIDVGGRPEEAASDGKGKLFVNLEDKSEIAVVDLKTHSVLNHWKLTPGEGPTGLAYDAASNRLFAGCDKLLVVMNATDGAIVDKIKIGDGCDGVAFDAKQKLIFTSNGEGTLSVIKEASANQFTLLGNYPTKRGARTIALDQANGNIFLPTADFDTAQTSNGRPRMIPGTFQVLVVQASK